MSKGMLFSVVVFFFVLLLFSPPSSVSASEPVPVTADTRQNGKTHSPVHSDDSMLSLLDFATAVRNGNSNTLVGVYAPLHFAYMVMQQPANDPGYIVPLPNTVTLFSIATRSGTVGLLAHNNFSGADFFDLSLGQEIDLVYGDGGIHRYSTSTIAHYQALSSGDPYSAFLDVDGNHSKLSSTDLFNRIYMGDPKLVLQTCISANGDRAWGRLFVIATPNSASGEPYTPPDPPTPRSQGIDY